MKKFNLIAAYLRTNTKNDRGIGMRNKLPWKIKEDMARFTKITTTTKDRNKINGVLMGRKTWESLKRPLKNRYNAVLSEKMKIEKENVKSYETIEKALKEMGENKEIEEIYVIGGERIYNETIKDKRCDKIYVTEIHEEYECDTYFPEIPEIKKGGWMKEIKKEKVTSEENIELTYKIYKNMEEEESEEKQYIELVKKILKKKNIVKGRNGNVYRTFGDQHVFDLSKGYPLLTTKKVFFRGVIEELLFFLKGKTDTKELEEKRINIWKENTTKKFLRERKLKYKEGDMGPMYGWQWRNYGIKYEGCGKNYKNKGYDQLKKLIENLIENKYDRRHLLTTYNPEQVQESVLAPCHGLIVQFYVEDKKLNCKMYQRSVDVMLGYPFNIASYAALVHILCKITGYKPGELIMTLGDAHIYEDHINGALEQIKRTPLKMPELRVTKELENQKMETILNYIDELDIKDFELKHYNYHPSIKMNMVA